VVATITPEQLSKLLERDPDDVVLLDVREPAEREAARIEPSIHIPMDAVPDELEQIPRDRKVVVYCHHGARSEMVAGFLEESGFPDVANLVGGIDAWSERVDPDVPRYQF
jgi:rhodanese-related sulfurtransferase